MVGKEHVYRATEVMTLGKKSVVNFGQVYEDVGGLLIDSWIQVWSTVERFGLKIWGSSAYK